MSQKPETKFRMKVVDKLKTLPFTAVFSIQQRTIKGDPDLMVCMRGFFIGLELKSEEGEPSKLQEYKLEKIRKAQGRAYTVFPNNWDEIFIELTKLAKGI